MLSAFCGLWGVVPAWAQAVQRRHTPGTHVKLHHTRGDVGHGEMKVVVGITTVIVEMMVTVMVVVMVLVILVMMLVVTVVVVIMVMMEMTVAVVVTVI